jgi:DNA-directed RNA polymerase specialized sigma24 family protein
LSLEIRYYPFIIKVAKYFDYPNSKDLAQEVCIKLIENKLKANEIEADGKIQAYIYTLVKNEFLDSRRNLMFDLPDLDLIDEPDRDHKKELDDLIKEKNLPFIDRLWIDAFIRRDLSATWVESDLNIGRHCAKKRLKYVIEKLK